MPQKRAVSKRFSQSRRGKGIAAQMHHGDTGGRPSGGLSPCFLIKICGRAGRFYCANWCANTARGRKSPWGFYAKFLSSAASDGTAQDYPRPSATRNSRPDICASAAPRSASCSAARFGFDVEHADARVMCREGARRLQTLFVGGKGGGGFKRVMRADQPPYLIQMQLLERIKRDVQMALMRRVEGTAEQSNIPPPCG